MENTNKLQDTIELAFNGFTFKGLVIYDKDADTFDFDGIEVKDAYGSKYRVGLLLTKSIKAEGRYLPFTIEDAIINEFKFKNGLDDDLVRCDVPCCALPSNQVVTVVDGRKAHQGATFYFEIDGQNYLRSQGQFTRYRDDNGRIYENYAPNAWVEGRPYCTRCNCLVSTEQYVTERDRCTYCARIVIEGYSESHGHKPVYFGKYKDTFAGFGFELEVDSEDDSMESECESTAEGLCEASGLEKNEMRFAHDGSLRYGFEIISQPHTVEDFWSKTEKWEKMLKYLLRKGFRSHDPNTCGLHIHVSRALLGKTEAEQDRAIAKIYAFFDDNWKDIVRVSRRTCFEYCDKNNLDYYDYDLVRHGLKTKYDVWKKKAKGCGNHYVALNNRNKDTFEFRLGRGTLNAWSFFSWIDFILTISKNAKRITVDKVTSNDLTTWLAGITESTARYIFKRGAFQATMLTLYPSIEWSRDTSDTSDSNE